MNAPLALAAAFLLGFAARQVGLPPLVGYLVAGFVLHALGAEADEPLQAVADLGVTLLLFTIGLKLQLRSLLRPEVLGAATLHMGLTVAALGAALFALAGSGMAGFAGLDVPLALLLAFALSFSSTVFAVKVLEQRSETSAPHGRVAVGILIVQDLFAVLFLASAGGKLPSAWALLLLALPLLRPLLFALLDRSAHGELLILFGFVLAVIGSEGFEAAGVKGDLGALVVGVLVAKHPKASELARALLGFKDLFLIGFFLAIGLSGAPTPAALGVALLLALIVPLKVGLFFLLLTRFRLRARTSLLASLSLASYSEFGLIVGAVAVANGWLGREWLVIVAVALSLTFVAASPVNAAADSLYRRFEAALRRFQTRERLPHDEPIDPGDARIAVFGMGRVGTGAYDTLHRRFGDVVIGIDADALTVNEQQRCGRNVILGDATDPDFWERATAAGPGGDGPVRLVLLAMPNQRENLAAVEQLARMEFAGVVAATARFPDDREVLFEAGARRVYDFYAEAGAGFAEHVLEHLGAELELPEARRS